MTRVFVYEHLTGGGLLEASLEGEESLLREGAAMATAVAADFAKAPGVETAVLRDCRLTDADFAGARVVDVATESDRRSSFRRLAAQCDWTLVIAPEFDATLFSLCDEAERVGGRLLGPSSEVVRRLSDKHATCEWLSEAGIPTPAGVPLGAGESPPRGFRFPAVLKPRDGAGSRDVRLLDQQTSSAIRATRPSRLEEFCPGSTLSVALLAGPQHWLTLPPCLQRLSDDGRFRYLGGALPAPSALARRATNLAGRVARRLCAAAPSGVRGYLGIDMTLGDDPRGAGDMVIEINPRLTTSYVGLRAATGDNLAAAMLRLAAGRKVALGAEFAAGNFNAVEFDASGRIQLQRPLESAR